MPPKTLHDEMILDLSKDIENLELRVSALMDRPAVSFNVLKSRGHRPGQQLIIEPETHEFRLPKGAKGKVTLLDPKFQIPYQHWFRDKSSE